MATSPVVYVLREGKRVRVRLGGPIPPANVEVAARIRTAIERGHLRAGDQLPSENELAALFETSRDTVRRGLVRLGPAPDGEGLIRGEQGRGWRVVGND